MDIYLSIDGQKEGPISQMRVGDWIEAGKVNKDTLGWHRDLDTWKPLGEIAALDTFFQKDPVRTASDSG